jgi:hypothetical protein
MEMEVEEVSNISRPEEPAEVERTWTKTGFSTPGVVSSCEGDTGEYPQPMAASTLRKVETERNLWAMVRPDISPTSFGSLVNNFFRFSTRYKATQVPRAESRYGDDVPQGEIRVKSCCLPEFAVLELVAAQSATRLVKSLHSTLKK